MKSKHVLLIVLFLLVIYGSAWAIRQKNLYQKSCFKTIGGHINAFGLDGADIDLTMQFKNKTEVPLHIKNQKYDVYFNDKWIAQVVNNDKIYYPANSDTGVNEATNKPTHIVLNIKFVPRNVFQLSLQNLKDLLTNKDNIRVRIKGNIDIRSGIFFVNKYPVDIQYTLKELLAPSTSPC